MKILLKEKEGKKGRKGMPKVYQFQQNPFSFIIIIIIWLYSPSRALVSRFGVL
jgi:hypothetical protein